MKLKEAILKITTELKNDAGYRYSWKANIVMAYKDCEHRYMEQTGKKQLNKDDKHIIANDAAEYFLKLFCSETKLKNKDLTSQKEQKFDGKIMSTKYKNKTITSMTQNSLLVAVVFIMIWGAYCFGKAVSKDVAYKKEMIELEKEKLRLEIELKKLELSDNFN